MPIISAAMLTGLITRHRGATVTSVLCPACGSWVRPRRYRWAESACVPCWRHIRALREARALSEARAFLDVRKPVVVARIRAEEESAREQLGNAAGLVDRGAEVTPISRSRSMRRRGTVDLTGEEVQAA